MEDKSHPLDAPEVSEENISDLFAKLTSECSEAELDKIIEVVRAARSLWEQEENSARRAGRRPNPHKGLRFEDLDLDI